MTSDPNEEILRNKVEVRQGSTRPRVIYVLMAGLALVILAFIIASFFFHHQTAPV